MLRKILILFIVLLSAVFGYHVGFDAGKSTTEQLYKGLLREPSEILTLKIDAADQISVEMGAALESAAQQKTGIRPLLITLDQCYDKLQSLSNFSANEQGLNDVAKVFTSVMQFRCDYYKAAANVLLEQPPKDWDEAFSELSNRTYKAGLLIEEQELEARRSLEAWSNHK